MSGLSRVGVPTLVGNFRIWCWVEDGSGQVITQVTGGQTAQFVVEVESLNRVSFNVKVSASVPSSSPVSFAGNGTSVDIPMGQFNSGGHTPPVRTVLNTQGVSGKTPVDITISGLSKQQSQLGGGNPQPNATWTPVHDPNFPIVRTIYLV